MIQNEHPVIGLYLIFPPQKHTDAANMLGVIVCNSLTALEHEHNMYTLWIRLGHELIQIFAVNKQLYRSICVLPLQPQPLQISVPDFHSL